MGQDNCKPQPGDLIEIDRRRHQHWALYMGDGYVINITPLDKQDLEMGVHMVPVYIRKVKKQRLKEVVKNNKWRINNKYDHSYSPLPVKEIIQRAENYNDRELNYRGFGSNCEHFVTKLRYGEGVSHQLRAFLSGKMHILDMTEDKDYPNPGDLIEIKQGSYVQWALYVGDGYVIHITPVDEGAQSLSACSGSIPIRKARVTKEILKVGVNDDWAVNNKCDLYRTPLPVDEIIWRAECCTGKELLCDALGRCSEDFVTKLRYGGQLRPFISGKMHILDMTEEKDYPNPGDLIEIKRRAFQHWALYLGKGYVIHVTSVDEEAQSLSATSELIFLRKGKVKKELLEVVAGNDKWHVNNKYDCYRTPFPMEEIIRRAEQWIGKEVTYRLLLKNCEHFVTKLRYGEGVSEQAKAALQNINSVSSVVMAGIGTASFIVARIPFMASAPFVAAGSGGLLASIGFSSSNIVHSITFGKFKKAGKNILEQSCC